VFVERGVASGEELLLRLQRLAPLLANPPRQARPAAACGPACLRQARPEPRRTCSASCSRR